MPEFMAYAETEGLELHTDIMQASDLQFLLNSKGVCQWLTFESQAAKYTVQVGCGASGNQHYSGEGSFENCNLTEPISMISRSLSKTDAVTGFSLTLGLVSPLM